MLIFNYIFLSVFNPDYFEKQHVSFYIIFPPKTKKRKKKTLKITEVNKKIKIEMSEFSFAGK